MKAHLLYGGLSSPPKPSFVFYPMKAQPLFIKVAEVTWKDDKIVGLRKKQVI